MIVTGVQGWSQTVFPVVPHSPLTSPTPLQPSGNHRLTFNRRPQQEVSNTSTPLPAQRGQTTEYTFTPTQQTPTTLTPSLSQKQQPTQYTVPQSTSGGQTVSRSVTTEFHTPGQPKVDITSEDVLGCLGNESSSLTLDADEVWIRVDYAGNTSGSPRLHAPSTCRLQVRGPGQGVMSLLVFNVTCFSDNRLVVHSRLPVRRVYDCDPATWMAPGVELTMRSNLAAVSITIDDVDRTFGLHARFKTVSDNESKKLEIRRVSEYLGTRPFQCGFVYMSICIRVGMREYRLLCMCVCMYVCFVVPLEPNIHGRESGTAPVQRLSHFKHLHAQVFCATYISGLQVLRRWGSGEATGVDAVDESSLTRSLYKESTKEAPSWSLECSHLTR